MTSRVVPVVTDREGQVADVIALEDRASQEKVGRVIPLNPIWREAL